MADFNDEIQATPITSFTSDIKAIAEKGELEYPKYRTLSQEQTTSYLKAKNLPEYQRKQALVELNKAKGQSGLKNARNQAVLQASDYLSGRNTEMWLGNSLASEDYAELVATVGAGVVGGTVGAEIGKGAVAKATTSKILQSAGAAAGAGIGASVLGGMVSAFTPTELGKDELPAELRDTTGFEAITKETSAEILRQNGYSEEQIEKLQKGEYLQTIGQKLILDSMSDMEYKANVLPKVEEGSIAAELTSGVMSFGEYGFTGIAGRVLGKASAKAVQKDKFAGDRFGKLQTRKEEQYGKKLDDVIERYGDIIGGKVGGAVVTAEMSSDIMGEGATKSVIKYIEETGDDKLLFYKADNKDIALDIASTHIQNVIENKLGVGAIIKNPRLAKKYGEWLSGFAQEFTQGEVSDISEWLKGTQGWEDVVNGVGKNITSGAIGAVLQGATGTAVYSYYHRKNVNALTDMIMKQSTPEAPLNEKQVRQFADQKLKDIESEVQVDMVKEIGDFLGASDDVGAIKNKIRDNVIEAINHQKEIMKDTIDGSAFDDMTEDEMAQYVEGVASDQTDNAVLYSLEEGTAISDSPMMKGETIDGTYYLEGKSYAGDNKKEQAQRRQVLKNAVYDNNNDDKSVKDIVKTVEDEDTTDYESVFFTNKISEKLNTWEKVKYSSLLGEGGTYAKGKRGEKATDSQKRAFFKKMVQKYLPQEQVEFQGANIGDLIGTESLKSLESLKKELIMSDNLVDLSKEFKTQPNIEDVKSFINSVFNNGMTYATMSPDWLIDLQGNKKNKNHIIYSEQYNTMSEAERKRHHKYVIAFEKIINKAIYDHTTTNTKNDKKPNVAKYHYFVSHVQIGKKIYKIVLDTEERVGENTKKPQTVHLYNIKEPLVNQVNGFNDTGGSYDSIITDKSGVVKQGNKNIVDNIEKQGARGGVYDPKTRSITLGGKADASTLPHEFAHYWIDKNFKWARSGKASQQWLEKWRAVEKFLGIDPDDKFLPKGSSEDFARAYERFVAEEEVPLVLKGAMMDFRDFVNDHYDEDLDDAKGLYDHFGRPIHINDEVKEWFKKSRYEDYLSPEERQVVKNRIIKDKEEIESVKESVKEQESMEEIADKLPVESDLIENSVVIPTEEKTTPQVAEKRKIGGGEEKESKGVIGQELGKTYESTSWDIQEELVDDYLSKVNVDTALEDLENGTYPQSIDANFLRSALVELLTEQGRENEALDLIEQTAESFTESAQVLQAARKLNTPFTNAIKMFEGAKAVQVANSLYGKKKDSLAKLDEKINTIIKRYEKDYLACKTDEDVQRVLDLIKKEAVNTFGIKGEDLQFQTKEEKVFKKSQLRRGNINAYRSRAKQTLRRALGISPTKAQVKAIKKHAVEVSKAVKEYRKAVKENKASAIDPTPVLEAQNRLNNYMVSQVPQGSFADMANSFMMANVLSNPATNTFNVYSTWVQMIPHILALKLNYGVGSIGWKEKAKIIKQALKLQGKTGYNIFSLRDFFDKKTIWAEKYYEPTSKLGKIHRFPLTTLGLADTLNKGITFLTAVDSIATNKAKKEGLKGDALKKRAKELFYQALNTDPKTITKDGFEIRKQAVEEGEESTFTQNTQTAQAINKLRKTLNLGKKFGLGTVVMPFTTTIANIAEDTFKNYMFGSVKGLVNAPRALALEFDKRATEEMKKEAWKSVTPKTKDVIKNLIGAMLLLAGLVPDDDDYVLGYDRQTEKDKDIRQNRNAPYSYAVRIGNKWVDLDTFGLGSQPMKMMLILRRNNFSSEGYMQAFASLIDMVPGIGELDDMYNKFSSTKSLAGMEKATTEAISDKLEELSVRMIPFSALFGQIASIEDDKKRETWNHWYDGMRAKIPYLRDTLPERTSSKTGQVIPQTDDWFNLATGSKIKDYKPASESDRARYQAYELGAKLQYKEKRSFEKYGETLQKSMTKQAKDTFNRKLPILMNSAKFKNMTDEEKKKAISKLHSQVVKDLKKNK